MFCASLPRPGRKPGGVDIQVSRLSDELVAAGHQITVMSHAQAPEGAAYHHIQLRPAHFADSSFARIVAVPALLNAQRFDRFDVLHLHGDDWFLRKRPLPTVRTFYGSALYEGLFATRLRRRATQLLIARLERMAADRATVNYGITPGDLNWLDVEGSLPCGVDTKTTSAAREERPTILFVGTLHGRKRGDFLLRAFEQQVLPEVPAAQLWMVSDECPEAAGVSWFQRPSDDELADLYRRAWVLAAPSRYEGFGIFYAEAQASGTPVVATPNPGSVYLLDHGRAGRLVEDEDFAGALVELLRDPDRRAELASAGRERVQDFAWPRVVEQHLAAYEVALRRWSAG